MTAKEGLSGPLQDPSTAVKFVTVANLSYITPENLV